MKKRIDHVWFHLARLFQWHRILGIGGLSILAYVLVFFVFNNADVGGFLPRTDLAPFHWPDLPKFLVSRPAEKGGETIYTVPTRQLTPQEMSRLPASAPATNSRAAASSP